MYVREAAREMETDWRGRLGADSKKSCQPCYAVWSGFCRQAAGKEINKAAAASRDGREDKEEGHIHSVEIFWEARTSKAGRKHDAVSQGVQPGQNTPQET